MQRPKQHQIEDKAYKQFAVCIPSYWVARSQTHDYGIDREVEIFGQETNGSSVSTGNIFKVQIKGTENIKKSRDGNYIKFQLEVDKINYLCNEIKVPTFFILVDVNKNRIWWYAIQIDKKLKYRLDAAKKKGQKKCILNIPSINILPDTLNLLVTTFDDIKLSHACDSFVELPQESFNNLSLSLNEISELERKFTDKLFITKTLKLWQNKDHAGLEKAAKEALSNISSSISTKVSAILCIEKVNEYRIKDSPVLQSQLDQICLDTSNAIYNVTRGESKSWRLFSAIVRKSALLCVVSSNDFALYINRKIHDADDKTRRLDFVLSTILDSKRQRVLRRVLRIYSQCLRLINLALNLGEYWMVPKVVLRVVQALPSVFIHLWGEQLSETANLFRDSCNDLINKAVFVSFALKDWGDMSQLVYAAFTTNSQINKLHYQETYNWAFKVLDGIPDESKRKECLEFLEDFSQKFDPCKSKLEIQEPDIPTEEEYQIYTQMAQAMGVNFDDPNDAFAQVIRIGLQDLNPERVLKKCKHLFVFIGHYGIIAQMLTLNTAGSKYLCCLRKKVAVSGLSLDKIYNLISLKHCSKCKFKEPRSSDWKWSRSWQSTEEDKKEIQSFKELLS